MALFGAKNNEKKEEKGALIGFTKPKKFLFFKVKSKPIYEQAGSGTQQTPMQQAPVQQAPKPTPIFTPSLRTEFGPETTQQEQPAQTTRPSLFHPAARQAQKTQTPLATSAANAVPRTKPSVKPSQLQIYFMGIAAKHKDLEAALRAQGIKENGYEFIKKMFIYSLIICVVITITLGIVLYMIGVTPVLAILLGVAVYFVLFNRFIQYPIDRSQVVGKDVEKDILFAARDLVISMRSGMPLYNAITAVSTGYGAASQEFAKVVELVQLGEPIEQAMDEVSARSQSKTFKRIMLQATVSLKAGADVIGALQGVVDEVMQERVIELRKYGQRLNALAMFYMLFGVIFPSMGIAVAAILTTFINIFTVDANTLLLAVIGIFFLQIIFLNIMRSSRPTFAM